MSWFLGPLPWIGSWIRSAWRLRISFQGSPSRDSPCIRSLAKRAFNYALGSMIPRPPHEKGSVKESHLTFARVLDVFPPQMKLHITPVIWLHILGLGFQQVAKYHMDETRTCLAIRIMPTKERLQLPLAIILPLKAVMSLSKLTSAWRWKPT